MLGLFVVVPWNWEWPSTPIPHTTNTLLEQRGVQRGVLCAAMPTTSTGEGVGADGCGGIGWHQKGSRGAGGAGGSHGEGGKGESAEFITEVEKDGKRATCWVFGFQDHPSPCTVILSAIEMGPLWRDDTAHLRDRPTNAKKLRYARTQSNIGEEMSQNPP